VILVSGTVQTSGTGQINIFGSGTGPTLDGVTLSGTVVQGNNQDATVSSGLTNNATWNMNGSSTSYTDITFNGDITLGGSGEIVMSNNWYNRLQTDGSTLTQGAGHTIRGAGQLLFNTGGMINQGTLVAEGTGTNTLRINPSALGFDNQGTMTASGTAGIYVLDETGTDFTTSGTVTVDAGSTFQIVGGIGNGIYTQTAGSTTINGALSVTTSVDISGGTFGGDGTVTTLDVNITGATVSPGASPGELDITGNYTQDGTSTLEVEIDGYTQSTEFDFLDVSGTASIAGTVDVVLDPTFKENFLTVGDTFEIVDAAGGLSGNFSTINVNITGVEFVQDITANDITLRVTEIPEPGTLTIISFGLLWTVARRRRK
jgi:hypothetical protein